jgi:small GTP-binding protein
MGGAFSRKFGASKHLGVSIAIIGLDHSGKSTIAQSIGLERNAEVAPTVGCKVEKFQHKTTDGSEIWNIEAYDFAGAKEYRDLWETHFQPSEAIIFVVDAAAPDRFGEAREALHNVLRHNEATMGQPILVLANKMDLATAVTAPDCFEVLHLHTADARDIHIQATSGLTGEGIPDVFQWLMEHVVKARKRKKHSARKRNHPKYELKYRRSICHESKILYHERKENE